MGIALHPYIMGQPHRLRHLDRALTAIAAARDTIWITTAGAIDRHYRSLFPPPGGAQAESPGALPRTPGYL